MNVNELTLEDLYKLHEQGYEFDINDGHISKVRLFITESSYEAFMKYVWGDDNG